MAPPTVDYAIEAYNLRKVYRTRNGKHAAVDGLDLRVPLGGIHGFLGPNGAGKTTTIRPWTPDGNIAAIVDHGYTYSVPVEKATPDGLSLDVVEEVVSVTHGVVYWSTALALLITCSLLIFRRRDVV